MSAGTTPAGQAFFELPPMHRFTAFASLSDGEYAPTATLSAREYALICALQRIVLETMDYSPVRPIDGESHLPSDMVEQAQQTLSLFGLRVAEVRR